MNLDGPRQYTWRVTADLVVSRMRGAALFQSQANLISVALLDCNNWGANWRAEWRSYHPLFMCWVFFQGLCKGVLQFSINYSIVKSQKKQLEAALLKRDSGGTDQDTQQNNNSTTLSEPEYLKGVFSRSTYIHILSLLLFIHITQQINMSICYIYMIYHPLFLFMSNLPGSLIKKNDQFFIETETENRPLFFFLLLLVWRYMVLLFYSIYVSGVCPKDRRPTEGVERSSHFQYAPWIKGKKLGSPGKHGSPYWNLGSAPKR